jgi:hypothetical protein
MYTLILSLLIAAVTAQTTDPEEKRCSRISARCTKPAQLRSATKYCESILYIDTTTSTVYTSVSTVAASCGITPSALAARDVEDEHRITARAVKSSIPKPGCLGGATKQFQQNSECNCLSITTPTKTVTNSQALTVTGPFEVQASGGDDDGRFFSDSVSLLHTYIYTPRTIC